LTGQPALDTDMPVLIVQHPDGSPLKFALDTKGVMGVNGNGTRVRYATNTEHGSSGSPCFNIDWEIIALHHLGDPAWKAPTFNEGVPIGMIATRLAAHQAQRVDDRSRLQGLGQSRSKPRSGVHVRSEGPSTNHDQGAGHVSPPRRRSEAGDCGSPSTCF